ncbi:hypothetical protein [Soonwooa purpurea]
MMKKNTNDGKEYNVFDRILRQGLCLFLLLVFHSAFSQIHISDGATLYVAKDTLVSISKSEVKPNKAKIYVVSGTVVSNLDKESNYETVNIPATQTTPKLRTKDNVLKNKEKKALARKTSPQKKTIQPQPKINFSEGNSDAHLSFSELHFNMSVLTQHENQNQFIEAKQSVCTLFLTSIKGLAPNYYYSNHYASQYSTSLLGRAPPFLV